MFEILKNLQVDWRDRRLLKDLYVRQEAVIRVAGEDSESGIIGRGVEQVCFTLLLLFSIYAEVMMMEALEKVVRNEVEEDVDNGEDGVRIEGQLVRDVGFSDD